MKRLVILALTILPLILPVSASADQGWVLGEWRLVQYDDKGTSYTGRLLIQREGYGFHGRIYFDVVGNWEPLEGIEVTDETIRFVRPMYKQRFEGHRNRSGMLEGSYKDWLYHNMGTWRAGQ